MASTSWFCAQNPFSWALFRSHDTLYESPHHVILGRSDVLGFAAARSASPWVNHIPIC
jgi:hypothetical protein